MPNEPAAEAKEGARSPRGRSARRTALLDAAAVQLNAKGLSQTTLVEIGATLGISRSGVYHHVESLEDLVFQAYMRACELLADQLERAAGTSGPEATITAFISGVLDPSQPEIAALAETGVLAPEQRALVTSRFSAVVERLAAVIAAGTAQGQFRAVEPRVAANTLLSLLFWISLANRWSRVLAAVSRADAIEAIRSVALTGIAAHRREPADFEPIDLSSLRPPHVGLFARQELADVKHAKLVAAASYLFNRKGIDATSLEEIAALVGATKRTLYHHVGDKQELVGACYQRAFKIFHFIRDRVVDHPGSRLDALTAAYFATVCCNLDKDLSPLMPLVGFEALRASDQAAIEAAARKNSLAYLSVYAEGQYEDTVRRFDINAVTFISPGAFTWLARDETLREDLGPETVAREIATFLRLGLRRLD